MATIPFDVNDSELRDRFLRDLLPDALRALDGSRAPRWGKMTAQQMVEHLAWTFEVSTGRVRVECPIAEGKRERMKAFLYHDRPSPPGFMNPALAAGLPSLRHDGMPEAWSALRIEVDRFLQHARVAPDAVHTHPVFGPIGVEEWGRTHFKHGYHHLLQFGLIESE